MTVQTGERFTCNHCGKHSFVSGELDQPENWFMLAWNTEEEKQKHIDLCSLKCLRRWAKQIQRLAAERKDQ